MNQTKNIKKFKDVFANQITTNELINSKNNITSINSRGKNNLINDDCDKKIPKKQLNIVTKPE